MDGIRIAPAVLIGGLILLGITSSTALEDVKNLELEWTFNTSAQFLGTSFGAGHQSPPTVWDLDGDGVNEVLWGTRRGHSKRLWCIEGNGIFKWVYPPIEKDGLSGDPTSKVSIVDVDGDGSHELCFAGRGGRLHVLNPDGSVKWTWEEPDQQTMHGAPQAYDVDGDGYVEFFLNTNNGFIHRVDAGRYGPQLAWTSSQAGKGNPFHPTICDLDRDGDYEVVFGSKDFYVYCLDAADGSRIWEFDVGASMKIGTAMVADVNGDGEYEVLVGPEAPRSGILCLNFLGKELWRWYHPREGVAPGRISQAVGDIDMDGRLEMVLCAGDGGFMIDIGGSQPFTEWSLNFTQMSIDGDLPEGAQGNHWSYYQLIADYDSDGIEEILWMVPFPVVTDALGGVEGFYVDGYLSRNRRPENGGWWGDVDGDDISEWVCDLNGNSHPETRLYCLSGNGGFPARASWPEVFHSAYPAEYQSQLPWLALKSAYSNSLWFPIGENLSPILIIAGLLGMVRANRMHSQEVN